MRDKVLEQMEILEPELIEKYKINLDKAQEAERVRRKKKEAEKREASGKAQKTPEIPKIKPKKPNMKDYLEKRAAIFKEAANKEGQKSTMDETLKKKRETAKLTPSLAAASPPPPMVTDNYEYEYFSHLSSIKSDEELEQNS
ncbi:hypothetical protein JTB14_034111 [Gonioctena quinquepunctata]|nr:hypothetical protein JTB14_034111 [Gonioctena quinquepunctata]